MRNTNPDRFTVTAIVTFHDDVRRHVIGHAPSRRQARRIGYQRGAASVPSRHSLASFTLEICDAVTGEQVRAGWAEDEAARRAHGAPTVGERGIW